MTTIHPDAEAFILRFEGGNERLEWPGEASGVTAACGYDFGYRDEEEILADWQGRVPIAVMPLLVNAAGVRGLAARDMARSPAYAAVRIPYEVSLAVFHERTMPKFIDQTLHAFPGCELMPELSFGALVSLVYNRGPSCNPLKPSRKGMADIRRFAPDRENWPSIIYAVAEMYKLRIDVPTDSNLPGRRLEEAAMFARGLREAGIIDSRTVIRGDTGAPVKLLQEALVARMAQLSIDGAFGLKTRQALWRYQLAKACAPATGIADMETLYDLGIHPRPVPRA